MLLTRNSHVEVRIERRHDSAIMAYRTKSTAKKMGVSDDTPMLTFADFRKMQAELEDELRLQKELPRRIEEKRRLIKAALLFAPKGFGQERKEKARNSGRRPKRPPEVSKTARKSPPPQIAKASSKSSTSAAKIIRSRSGQQTWTSEIKKALEKAGEGLSHKALRTAMEKSGMSARLRVSDKGFYGGISKLLHAGQIIKSGGLLYSRAVATELQKRGKPLPDKTAELRERGASALLAEVLEGFPGGLKAPQLQQLIGARQDAPASIREHRHYIYSILKTMIKSGRVTKTDDGIYRLRTEKGEANGVTSTVGFEAHA